MKKTPLIFVLLCLAMSLLCGCAGQAPDIEEVREDFCALIDASCEINDIFFGEGLPTYERTTLGGSMLYDAENATYYIYYDDPAAGRILKYYDNDAKAYKYLSVRAEAADGYVYKKGEEYYYPIDYTEPDGAGMYDDSAPLFYDYVRDDSKYRSVDDIKEAAERVYSAAYLESIYPAMFDGVAEEGIGLSRARYMADEGGEGHFLKSNEYEPLYTEETRTKYDTTTMRVLSSSTHSRVTVEIEATGRYLDYDTLEVKMKTKKKQLTFVLQDGEWRLDTPTY